LKHSVSLSDNFISEVFSLTAGFLKTEVIDDFFNALNDEIKKHWFTPHSENNLLRVVRSFFDRTLLIKDSLKYPHYLEMLVTTSVNSDYLCDILVRDPEYFYWIANPSNLTATPGKEEYERLVVDLTGHYKTFQSKLNALKSFKRKEILRTGMQDLLGLYPVLQITKQLSYITSSILDQLFRLCYKETASRHKIELGENYCIISLGKLGGRELNYSSDADFIIFYDKDKKTGSRYYSEYLTEAVKLFIDSSSKMTENGYLYRIDFRLRPDGRNSPLCRSINEYLSYYESRGEAWERQMLIKADFLSGDKKLYERFIGYLTPFIYPITQHFSPAEQVSRMKTAIEKKLKNELNIKLTKGGIRDIEFSVQVLQLLNGGRQKNLRQSNTLEAVEELFAAGLLNNNEKETFNNAYQLFRKIEHYLQLMNDRQVHTIPEAGEIVDKMAYYLGFNDRISFLSELNITRKKVREIYNSIIPADNISAGTESIFHNKQQSARNLDYLREGKELSGSITFDKNTQESFNEIEPLLFSILREYPDPDTILQNLTYVIKSSGIASIWYSEFRDEQFLRYFCSICLYNKKGITLLASDTSIQDFLLSRKVFTRISEKEMLKLQIKKFLFYLTVQFTTGLMEQSEVSKLLSVYCIRIIKAAAEKSLGKKGYVTAALGSLGSGEMTFGSDLDLIFVVDSKSALSEKKFRDLLNLINKELVMFKADCRLRPEGEGSQLSWDIENYIKYLNNRARIWELQAMCKLEFIAGEKKIFNKLVSGVRNRIKETECSSVKSGILEMRKKISQSVISIYSQNFNLKKGTGGLSDTDFLLQYIILCSEGDLYSECRGRTVSEIIDILNNYSDEHLKLQALKESSSFIRKLEMFSQTAFESSSANYPSDEKNKEITAAYLGFSISELDKKFKDIIKLNTSVFDKYLGT
jgi:[glutamine synthetase] adenylyltransferase / [glutamine synthetase]-adenylyl-L-tyrosine phosphorylase